MLTQFVLTYVSQPILDWYSISKDLPPCVFLFTFVVKIMYNTIATRHAIEVVEKWIHKISSSPGFPNNYPLQAINASMTTIMWNKHFVF
jgi:hypothetical protein